MVSAIRGATTVENDNRKEIIIRVKELVDTLFLDNELLTQNIISIHFTITDDLISINPAAALRDGNEYSDIALFCSQEPKCKNSLKKAIRVIITWNGSGGEGRPCYLHGAKKLRPDLVN